MAEPEYCTNVEVESFLNFNITPVMVMPKKVSKWRAVRPNVLAPLVSLFVLTNRESDDDGGAQPQPPRAAASYIQTKVHVGKSCLAVWTNYRVCDCIPDIAMEGGFPWISWMLLPHQ
jgi:hypothetical protein